MNKKENVPSFCNFHWKMFRAINKIDLIDGISFTRL